MSPTSLKPITTKPSLVSLLDVSVAHVHGRDLEILRALVDDHESAGPLDPLIVYGYGEGVFVYLSADFLEDMESGPSCYSPEFRAIYAWGVSLGCKYLQLDRDAAIYDDLPRFNR